MAQVLFFYIFSEKDLHLNVVEQALAKDFRISQWYLAINFYTHLPLFLSGP